MQCVRVGFAVDQNKIGPDMTIAEFAPVAGQSVIPMIGGKRQVLRQHRNDISELVVEGCPMPASQLAFEISFERSGALNPPHGGRV